MGHCISTKALRASYHKKKEKKNTHTHTHEHNHHTRIHAHLDACAHIHTKYIRNYTQTQLYIAT